MNPTIESRGWRARLEEAKNTNVEKGSEEHRILFEDAREWETCAIGENREQLKEKGYPFFRDVNAPSTNPAWALGLDFMGAVTNAHWDGALKVLTQIESLPPRKHSNAQ
jgi:hypothetical protein